MSLKFPNVSQPSANLSQVGATRPRPNAGLCHPRVPQRDSRVSLRHPHATLCHPRAGGDLVPALDHTDTSNLEAGDELSTRHLSKIPACAGMTLGSGDIPTRRTDTMSDRAAYAGMTREGSGMTKECTRMTVGDAAMSERRV
jgi:hypothetical protein